MPRLQRMRAIFAQIRSLVAIVSDPYRPERHYMRGPGPKCRARRTQAAD